MRILKLLGKFLLIVLLAGLLYGFYYAWQAFPIISGYGAKNICSCVFVAGRDPENVKQHELGSFPLSLGSFSITYEDSSATGTVFGLARQKAIFRKGLGCTLVTEISEAEFRRQHFNVAIPPAVDQDTLDWPMGNGKADSAYANVDREALNLVLDSAFYEPGPKKLRRTRAVIVVYDGRIIAERYAEGFNKDSRLIGWSMTKSITNGLVGILVKNKVLDVNNPAPVEEWRTDERSKITMHHLLQASSGLDWEENYGGPSGATNMLFKKKDMGGYAATVPLAHEPGKVFYYSSGTTNIISKIVRSSVGDERYHRFPYDSLLFRIGMFNTVIEPDANGTFVGSSYSFGPARDWARFGLLYYYDGIWNGQRILPEGWVEYSTTPAPGADRGQYGAQFWLNAGGAGNPSNRYYPDVPTDMFWADGFEGQNVFIIPSKKLVVVKLSLSQGDYLDDNQFLKGIIKAIQQ